MSNIEPAPVSGSGDVVQEAADIVTQLKMYGNEIISQVKNIPVVAQDFVSNKDSIGDVIEGVQQKVKVVASGVMDVGKDAKPLPTHVFPKVMTSYLWGAVCILMGVTLGQLVSPFLHPIIGAVFNKFVCFCIAYILLPLHFYHMVTKGAQRDESLHRRVLLFLSLAMGILSGFVLRNLQFPYIEPPSAIIVGCIGLTSGLVMKSDVVAKHRGIFLAATVGTGVFLCGTLSLAVRGTVPPSFAVHLCVSALMFSLCLQLTVSNVEHCSVPMASFCTVLCHMAVQISMFYTLGVNVKEVKM